MSHAVMLKGFDVKFRQLNSLLDSLEGQLKAENTNPKAWTPEQRAVLSLLLNVLNNFYNVVSELAASVRDD
jgi:hypothetical protein